MTSRVVIADDHAPTRAAVREALEADGFQVAGEAATAAAAVALAAELHPDICLLDINMPGNGIAAVAHIAERDASVAIVMLTVSSNDDDVFAAIRAGARGYLLKGMDPSRLPDALRAVLAGDGVLPGSLAARLFDEFRRSSARPPTPKAAATLSEREWEVLDLLRQGRSTADIARDLYVAPVTVRTHVAAMLRKLHVSSRDEMLRLFDDPTR